VVEQFNKDLAASLLVNLSLKENLENQSTFVKLWARL